MARSFNELYPPKNSIYKASESTTFAPDGYLSEEEGVGLNIPIEQQQEQAVNESDNKLDVQALIKEISLHPELIQLLQSLIKTT